ncbi:MAG: hypothetical protein WAV00_15630 [Nocardioides sp.]
MSKMDNLRAMREARYEQAAARAKAGPASTTPSTAMPRTPPKAPPAQAARAAAPAMAPEPAAEPDVALCGHRNMSGRTCTREAGHAAKSHRYS